MSNEERQDGPELQIMEVVRGDRLAQLRRIVAEHQACQVEGHLVDSFTASMLVQVCDALNEKNLAKFLALPLPKMADVGWKLVN